MPDAPQTTNPNPHPFAHRGHRNGALGMKAGDRFIYDVDGRHGWADEFLQDGDAFVSFDDGTHDTIKWNRMSPSGRMSEPQTTSDDVDIPQLVAETTKARWGRQWNCSCSKSGIIA